MYIIQNTPDIEAVVVKKETWEIVDEKRRARTCTCPSSTSSATSTEMVSVDAGTRRRSERVKVAPTRYASEVEEELLEASPHATALTAAVRHQQVLHEEKVLSSEEEESYNDSVRTFRCNPAIIRKQEKKTSTNIVI
jgi:hypothetical protein